MAFEGDLSRLPLGDVFQTLSMTRQHGILVVRGHEERRLAVGLKGMALASARPSHGERIERVIEAWFDYAIGRPTLSRLFVREVAEAEDTLRPEVQRLAAPMFTSLLETIEAGQREGVLRKTNPVHAANILSGATIWLLIGAQLMETGRDEKEPWAERLAQHRDELIGVARYLLGTEARGEEDESVGK